MIDASAVGRQRATGAVGLITSTTSAPERGSPEADQAGMGSVRSPKTEFVHVIEPTALSSPISVAHAIDLLAQVRRTRYHGSGPAPSAFSTPKRSSVVPYGPKRVTDAYLLALAVAHDGQICHLRSVD